MMWPSDNFSRACFLFDDEIQAEHALDNACRHLRGQAVMVLQRQGSLISNIDIAENLALVRGWKAGTRMHDIYSHALLILKRWELDEERAQILLRSRPSDLNDDQRRYTVLLRAALSEPRYLLITDDWFTGKPSKRERWWQIMQTHFDSTIWWWFTADDDGPTTMAWPVVYNEQTTEQNTHVNQTMA